MTATRRTALAAGGGGLTALALAGCGLRPTGRPSADIVQEAADGDIGGDIVFQTWSLRNETFTPFFEQVIDDFEAEHPGTRVHWMDQPPEGYEDKLLAQANSDSLPDVINIAPDIAFALARAGLLLDIGALYDDLEDEYVAGAVESFRYDQVEGTFGLPWYLGTDMNWWNLDGLAEVGVDASSLPTTIDELFEVARAVHESGGRNPVVSNMPDFAITSEGDRFTFATEENVELLAGYAELYQSGAMPPEVLSGAETGNTDLFIQDKVLWTTATSTFASDLENQAPSLLETTTVSERLGSPPLFAQGISVPSTSKNLATALAFGRFLTSDEYQIGFAKLAPGYVPGTQAAAADPSRYAVQDGGELLEQSVEIAATSMETAEVLSNPLWTPDMKTTLTQLISRAMTGAISPRQALEEAVEYGNLNLQ